MVHRSVGWRWRLIRTGRATILLGALSGLTGCNLCCPPYMDDYATIGGKWPRANPTEGRVGSAFSDPGVTTVSGSSGLPEYQAPGPSPRGTYHHRGSIEVIEPYPVDGEVIYDEGIIILDQ